MTMADATCTVEEPGKAAWPNAYKCAVTITFDLDAESAVTSMDPANAFRLGTLSAAAYGPLTGIPRILGVLRKHGIRATFFVPGRDAERHALVVRRIASEGHEISLHGYDHRRLDLLTEDEARREIEKGMLAVEKAAAVKPRGFRAPWWEMPLWGPELLIRAGLVYDSSLMHYDMPYRLMSASGSIIELPVSFILDDWQQFGCLQTPPGAYQIHDCDTALRLWWEEFQALKRVGALINLTLHPWLIGRASRVELLDEFVGRLVKDPEAWIAVACEVADFAAGQPAGGTHYVYEPSPV